MHGDLTSPRRVGVAVRSELFRWIATRPPEIECLELKSDQILAHRGRAFLTLVREWPLIVHASRLSLGAPRPLDASEVADLCEAVAAVDPMWIAACVGYRRTPEGEHVHPLPLAPTPDTLNRLADHCAELVARCGKPLALENITSPLRVAGPMSEPELLNRLCADTGCRLLVDVTSVCANARYHGTDPQEWLSEIEPRFVVQLHLGTCLREHLQIDGLDTSDIAPEVWELAECALSRAPVRAAVVERDDRFPPVTMLAAELQRLKAIEGQPVSAPASAERRPSHTVTR